jgi:hypothetical protein
MTVWTLVRVLMVVLIILQLNVARAEQPTEFKEFLDPQTGSALLLPMSIFSGPKPTALGNSWSTPDNIFKVSTFNLHGKKGLGAVYASIRNKAGRRLTVDRLEGSGFILQGYDQDGSSFVVKAEEKEGEVRGVSITFENSAKPIYGAVAEKIALSFQGFPPLASAAVQSRSETASPCHLRDPKVANVVLNVRRPDGPIRSGDPIRIEWDASKSIIADCKTPLYLVLTTPMRSRFQGDGFLALPPNAKAPYDIQYRSDPGRQ